MESDLMLKTLSSPNVEPGWKEAGTEVIVHWRCGKAGQQLLSAEGHRPWAPGISGAVSSGRGSSSLHTLRLSLLPFLFQRSEPHMSREEVRGAEF